MTPTCSSIGSPNSSRCNRTICNYCDDLVYDKVQKENAEVDGFNFIELWVACNLLLVVENLTGSWLLAMLLDTLASYDLSEACVSQDVPTMTSHQAPGLSSLTNSWPFIGFNHHSAHEKFAEGGAFENTSPLML